MTSNCTQMTICDNLDGIVIDVAELCRWPKHLQKPFLCRPISTQRYWNRMLMSKSSAEHFVVRYSLPVFSFLTCCTLLSLSQVLWYPKSKQAFQPGDWVPPGMYVETKLFETCRPGVGKRTAMAILQHYGLGHSGDHANRPESVMHEDVHNVVPHQDLASVLAAYNSSCWESVHSHDFPSQCASISGGTLEFNLQPPPPEQGYFDVSSATSLEGMSSAASLEAMSSAGSQESPLPLAPSPGQIDSSCNCIVAQHTNDFQLCQDMTSTASTGGSDAATAVSAAMQECYYPCLCHLAEGGFQQCINVHQHSAETGSSSIAEHGWCSESTGILDLQSQLCT